ncbi:MAG TPA: hypothetical protein DCF68_06775 [Cyanothece sp. UBA12306]|nr:hypothetical protein [Cyanothece sp. UBA12306]
MDSVHYQALSFQLEGQFLGFISKPNGQLKSLRLSIDQRELRIKLDKGLRGSLGTGLAAGDWIQVSGEQKFKGSFSQFKLKAFQVNRLSCSLECKDNQNTQSVATAPSNCQKKGKILLCNKSDCAKNGGKKLYQELEKTLTRLGLQDSVKIEKTSCQKRCSKAPNMILMPGKAKCSKPNPKTIDNLLRDHYLQSVNNNG